MYFDEMNLGHTISVPPAVIDREEMLDFARKYDNIPLHTDETYAKTTRFGGLIAPGVMSFMAVWAKYLEVDLFGDELVAGKSTRIEWLRPVYPGDVLTGEATITGLTRRNERNGIAELTIRVRNQDGTPVLTNVTEAIVKCREKRS